MLNNSECKNSSGWFKFPDTGEDITENTPRIITCKSGDNFTWPCVALNDGNIVRICYKCFTEDEKQCYKEYRGRSVSTDKTSKKQITKKQTVKKQTEVSYDEMPVQVYSTNSAISDETLATILMCDKLLGVSIIGGISYALLTCTGDNVIYHVPRSCIKNEQFERLSNNVG